MFYNDDNQYTHIKQYLSTTASYSLVGIQNATFKNINLNVNATYVDLITK